MDYYQASLALHEKHKGKMEVALRVDLKTREDLSIAYTPGVAQPCLAIHQNPEQAYRYTGKGRTIAVVSDGSAVLGLGNIGGLASLPVMEGKAILFKAFGDIDAIPICLDTQDPEEVVRIVKGMAPSFGGINLEDFAAPHCFEIERRLKECLNIPVFHDDQHGTAVAVCAAAINAFRFLGKPLGEVKAVICGAGAAGTAIARLLPAVGIEDIIICDRKGIICEGRRAELNPDKAALLEITNREGLQGALEDAVKERDIFIGVSGPDVLTEAMITSMNPGPVIFAMSNPEPEIMPEKAKAAGAAVIGTGRSDFPNQINNVLVFPGIFKGALNAGAKAITEGMKVAAAHALAAVVRPEELTADYIVPDVFNKTVAETVAEATAEAWRKEVKDGNSDGSGFPDRKGLNG